MKRFLCFFVFLALAVPSLYAQSDSFSHTIFDRVLSQYVDANGLVDYGALKANPTDLKAYLAQLAQFSPETTPDRFPAKSDSLAYWINAYNACAIAGVIEAYPVKSVRDIKWFYGFFNRIKHNVGGRQYTLKHIEHEIVRKVFDDPRIHAALNCASGGCPRLPQRAFKALTLDEALEESMRFFLREERNVSIDRERKRIQLSAILKEFETDFTEWVARTQDISRPTIHDYLVRYLEADDAEFLSQNPGLEISYFKYDWTLNDQALAER